MTVRSLIDFLQSKVEEGVSEDAIVVTNKETGVFQEVLEFGDAFHCNLRWESLQVNKRIPSRNALMVNGEGDIPAIYLCEDGGMEMLLNEYEKWENCEN